GATTHDRRTDLACARGARDVVEGRVSGVERGELLGEVELRGIARAVIEPDLPAVPPGERVARNADERRQPRAGADEEERALRIARVVATLPERALDLEHVARPDDVGEPSTHETVVDPLDVELEEVVFV